MWCQHKIKKILQEKILFKTQKRQENSISKQERPKLILNYRLKV